MSCLCLLEELLFTLHSIQSLSTFFLVHVIQIIAHFRIQTRRNDQHYSSTTLFGRCTLYSICTKMLCYVSSSVNLFKSGFAHLRENVDLSTAKKSVTRYTICENFSKSQRRFFFRQSPQLCWLRIYFFQLSRLPFIFKS